jgi:hypothetical protein
VQLYAHARFLRPISCKLETFSREPLFWHRGQGACGRLGRVAMQLSWPSERFACLRTSEGSARFADLGPGCFTLSLRISLGCPSYIAFDNQNPPDAHRPAEERAAIYTSVIITRCYQSPTHLADHQPHVSADIRSPKHPIAACLPTTAKQTPPTTSNTAIERHQRTFDTMGASISKMMNKIFGSKEMRLLMLGLDAAGKTSTPCLDLIERARPC